MSSSNAVNPDTQSYVPKSVQNAAPGGLERNLPDTVHNTDPTKTQGDAQVSHATGKSIVPESIQKLAPKGLEKALPDSIHDTSGLPKNA